MREKVLEFFTYCPQLFNECNNFSLEKVHLLPSSFIFNIVSNEVKELMDSDNFNNNLCSELCINFAKPHSQQFEILKIHVIDQNMVMVEANCSFDAKQKLKTFKIKCLFTLRLIGGELKIVSIVVDSLANIAKWKEG